jgi:hypothetical protein
MAFCGFNDKMIYGIRTFLDGSIEYGIIDSAQKSGNDVESQFLKEAEELSAFIEESESIIDIHTRDQIKGLALVVSGTFEKDRKRGVQNYIQGHISDTELLRALDNHFYNSLGGDIRNMPRLFQWVNKNMSRYK